MGSETDLIMQELREIRQDLRDSRAESTESRKAIRDRVDRLAEDVAQARTDITIGVHADAQVREELKDLKAAAADWKRIKTLGLGVAGLITLSGVSVGVIAASMGEAFAQWVRHLLRIP
ncbi:DUF1515 family protein [Martelella sp. FLE1502]